MGGKNKKGSQHPQYRPPPQNPQYNSHGAPPPYSTEGHYNQQQYPPPQQYHGQPRAQPPPSQPSRQRRPSVPSEVSISVKYFLFLYNFFFWLCGLLFIGAGVWAFYDRGALKEFTDLADTSFYVDPVWWLIMLGVIIFILATCGCLGALRENIFMLQMYGFLMGIILLLEIGGGVAIYFYRDTIQTKIESGITRVAIQDYRDNVDFQDIIDAVQESLSCCGVDSHNDWDMNIYFNCSGPTFNPEACGVPFSCCKVDTTSEVINTQCGYKVRDQSVVSDPNSRIYTAGCSDALRVFVNQYLIPIAIVVGIVVLVQLLGFCFAYSLINDIKRQKARWGRHR